MRVYRGSSELEVVAWGVSSGMRVADEVVE
jgi:hypothetical protein